MNHTVWTWTCPISLPKLTIQSFSKSQGWHAEPHCVAAQVPFTEPAIVFRAVRLYHAVLLIAPEREIADTSQNPTPPWSLDRKNRSSVPPELTGPEWCQGSGRILFLSLGLSPSLSFYTEWEWTQLLPSQKKKSSKSLSWKIKQRHQGKASFIHFIYHRHMYFI